VQKRILIVDDEEAILLAFKKLLQRPGIEVDTSETLDEAKRLIDTNVYSIIIADLRLSGTLDQEGFEIIALAKKKVPDSKVALITAYGSHGIQDKARKLGADFYFEKPVSVKNLNEILSSIM
jgi:DNA-binding NtrC family response regulator